LRAAAAEHAKALSSDFIGTEHLFLAWLSNARGPIAEALSAAGLTPAIMTDCSHANSSKDPSRQPAVFRELVQQSLTDPSIIGAMVESNINHGAQSFPQPIEDLKYGVSITDGCIDWDTTEKMIREAYINLAPTFSA
jgi:3-deoxy-7-phosphoheptulonate synthase